MSRPAVSRDTDVEVKRLDLESLRFRAIGAKRVRFNSLHLSDHTLAAMNGSSRTIGVGGKFTFNAGNV